MAIVYLQHVQVNVPAALGDKARDFYIRVLGLPEIPRPHSLSEAGRSGMWFSIGADQELHVFLNRSNDLGIRNSQHPALIVDDITELRDRIEEAGYEAEEAIPIEGRERFFTRDPGGNRIEFLAFADSK